MQVAILFIIFALAISAVGNFLNPGKVETPPSQTSVVQVQEVQQEPIKKDLPQTKLAKAKGAQSIAYQEKEKKTNPTLLVFTDSAPTVSIDTYIKSGPLTNEVIDETNKVTFEFGAMVLPEDTQGQITFETKVEGFEDKWITVYEPKRTIELPGGIKEYTFLVRAKINDVIDSTPAKRNFKINISPYFGKVKISSVAAPTPYSPSLIIMTIYLGKNERINITNWEIRGKYGSFVIPKGIENYNPLSAPLLSQDIFVGEGDIIYISGDSNPLGGKDSNFRPNKCMGYLTWDHNFSIPLSRDCPRPQKEKLSRYLDRCCQDYILSLGSCELPNYQRMQNYGLFIDPDCVSYITSYFNYPGCYANYFQSQDFFKKEWHIYMDRKYREIISQDCDTIYLRDKNGLFVDKYNYGYLRCQDRSR